MQWIAAGNGINMNYRFSQSGRTERNRQNHLYIEGRFPFANVTTHDPITRETDSRYKSCERTHTCPLGVEIYSANEYWVKAASLHHTTPDGTRDLPDSKFTRNYFMSSMRHGTAPAPTARHPPSSGLCQQADNPLNSAPVQRALFIALDQWATEDRNPPHSRVPKLRDGTLAPPLPQSEMGFPNIPGVTYTGLKTTRYHFDYGLNFYETGIATVNPPLFPFTTPSYQDDARNGPIYPSFVPKTDGDGNDIAGVRLPDVTVPLATTRLGAAAGSAGERRLRGRGAVHPVREDRGGPREDQRSASLGRGTLQDLRRLPRHGEERARANGIGPPAAVRRRRHRRGAADASRITRGVPAPAGGVLPAVELLKACREDRHHGGDHDRDDDDDDD